MPAVRSTSISLMCHVIVPGSERPSHAKVHRPSVESPSPVVFPQHIVITIEDKPIDALYACFRDQG